MKCEVRICKRPVRFLLQYHLSEVGVEKQDQKFVALCACDRHAQTLFNGLLAEFGMTGEEMCLTEIIQEEEGETTIRRRWLT